MEEVDLTQKDRDDIKESIIGVSKITIISFVAIFVVFGIIILIADLAIKPKEGFLGRSIVLIYSFIFCFALVISIVILNGIVDLKIGKKIHLETNDFFLERDKKKDLYIKFNNPKVKFLLDELEAPFIDITKPITVEYTKFSKDRLYLSQDGEDINDKAYKDVS